ncbi:hypothetical protein [Rhizobium mongolense]|uniref:4-aminobutyrate aminotransferase-like enzyme n=1 Tax=Rhizobium mongolense TaxID=57676 RepID=A0ABR6IY77_9HYPH|nr:hypothetical protein [Rhizobium mongolense]MBB4232868.1 4-aminobutyrate aminotransferase-like enzyme [Rhizobium mongolense]
MPYDAYWGADNDTSEDVDKVLADASSGVDLAAAIILETVQGEGTSTLREKSGCSRSSGYAESVASS